MPPRRRSQGIPSSTTAIVKTEAVDSASYNTSPTASTNQTRSSSRTIDSETPATSVDGPNEDVKRSLKRENAESDSPIEHSENTEWGREVSVIIPPRDGKFGRFSARPLKKAKQEEAIPSLSTSVTESESSQRDSAPRPRAASSRAAARIKRQPDSDPESDPFTTAKALVVNGNKGKGKARATLETETDDSAASLVTHVKGKSRAMPSDAEVDEAFKIADDVRNYDISDSEDDKPLASSSKVRSLRKLDTQRFPSRTKDSPSPDSSPLSDADAVELDGATESEYNSDDDSITSASPVTRRKPVRRKKDTFQQLANLSDDSSEGEEDEEFEPAGNPAAGSSRGFYAEEQRYETAKQRKARLKSEKYQKRLKKPQKLTRYQKTVASLSQHHPELVDCWTRLSEQKGNDKKKKAEQPEGLTCKLLPFQLEGLSWLSGQEKGEWKGGILADEMGMGKTVQMISLFLSDRKKPTLVVAPVVAIMQWRNEIAKYTKDFKVLVWHGASRDQDSKKLASYDVVLTSYSVMESAYRKEVNGFKRKGNIIKEKSALHAVQWHRVVLDEAHNIKERATNTAKAAFELKSQYRWCLSGTPLMNRVGELYSMIRFLNGDPYGYYYCKRCPCKSLHWMFSDRRSCDKCGHTPMHHVCFWNISILRPIQSEGTQLGEGGDAFRRLRIMLDKMMLRRTKLERADDMGLPPRTVVVRKDHFNEEEEDLYDSLYRQGARKFSTYLDAGTVLNNYSNIFTLLTRMRQIACHPDLVLRSKTGIQKKLLGDAAEDSIHLCRICAEEATEPIVSKCRHVFCRECVREYLDAAVDVAKPDCPYCHAVLSINLEQEALEDTRPEETRQGILAKIDTENWRSSTKIEALVEELNEVRREDSTTKSIVFSQFVNFLDLIAFRLQRAGFKICRLEGNMTPETRDRTVQYFMKTPDVTVFLVSLKAGGVALNLTEANRVYIMDPWWNMASLSQSADRIHRLGQTRAIKICHLVIENSIESRVLELAHKKANMVAATLSNDDSAMGRLSVSDLQFLFRM